MSNQDTIERLKHEISTGESSLDTAMRVFAILGRENPLFEEFNDAYELFTESGDSDDFPQDLLERICDSLALGKEYEDPFLKRHQSLL